MSASSGIGSRLSRKRKNEDSSQSQVATGLHDITDDFEDISTVYRLPKRSKVEKLLAPTRSRGRPKKSQPKRTPCDNKENSDDDDFSDTSMSTEDRGSEEILVIEDNDCILELDESFLNKDEKLCRSCKHIVPAKVFDKHIKECFQKFKFQRNTRSTIEPVPSCSNIQESKSKEKKLPAVQKKETLQILPCPMCLKAFKSRSQRHSHIKSCGQKKGLSGEEVISAVRLQEKQAAERIELGLPVIAPQSSSYEDKEKGATTVKGRGRSKKLADTKDPDLAMAIALSRSVAEEEAEKRASQEEKLLALGLDNIVEEDRKVKPVVLLPYASSSLNANKVKDKGRGTKGRRNFRNTVLATRSVADRERIISEKVAAILACDDTNSKWKENSTQGGRGRLEKFRDEDCTLWGTSSCNLEQPLEKYYVDDLKPYIKPKKVEVGRLLKRLSDIPGRLNVTVMQNVNENSDSESDVEEETVLEDYCTQLAMAELLGSQELNMTRANVPTSPDLSLQDDHQDPASNVTLEAASGFWLIHPAESKEDSSNEADEDSKNREIEKEEDSLAKAKPKVFGESENSTKESFIASGKPKNGDDTNDSCKHGGNSCSSESSELVLKLDNSSGETACKQSSQVNSLSCTENEDLGHLESSSCKNDSLASSFCNITSPKKMCRISLSGHILSGMCSDKQKGEDSLSQISDCSSEQMLCSSDKSSLSVENHMASKLASKTRVTESQDSEILCVLDTSANKDTRRSRRVSKRLSLSQQKANQSGELVSKSFTDKTSKDPCSLNSMSPHMNCSTSSQEEALRSRRILEEETPDEVANLSDSSCDSNKTEVFGLRVGKDDSYDSDKTDVFGFPVEENDNQNLDSWELDCGSSIGDKKDRVKEIKQKSKDEDLNSRRLSSKSRVISTETKKEKSDRRESISADECNSSLLIEAEVPKIDNESDGEGSGTTLLYDDDVCDEILSVPCSDESNARTSDSEMTLAFENQEEKSRASTVSKKSLDFQDENHTSNVPSPQPGIVDMDETMTYVKGDLPVSNDFKTPKDPNDSTVLYPPYIVKCLSQTTVRTNKDSDKSSVPEQRDVNFGITLPSEDYSKAGETGINQILEAFEETIPSRYVNTANKSILKKKDARNADLETTLPFQNQEKKRNRANTVLKKSSDFQDENDNTNVPSPQPDIGDMDETKTYLKGDLPVSNDSKTPRNHNDSTVLYPPHIVKCLSQTTVMPKKVGEKSSVPEQRDVNVGITLPSEDYSKAGETAIHQILEAFEETIPSRYANTANKTSLNERDVNAKVPVSSGDSNQLDDTLSNEMIDELMETINLPKSTDAMSLDETVVYEDSNDGDVTILHHPVDGTPAKNSVALDNDIQVENYSKCSSETHNVKDTEGDKISSKDCDIRSSFSNASPKQRNTRDNSEMDKRSNSMQTRLVYDWGSLLASGEESDVTISVNGDEELNAHSVVLLARCPELYSDVKNSKRRLTWNEVSYEGAYIFLVYLYTGDCKIKTKDDPLWMDVFDLALKYKSEELISFLESLYKIGNSPVKEGSSSLNGLEFSAAKVLPKNLEPVEKTHTSGGVVTRENPKVDASVPNSKMNPEKTSTLVRSSPTNADCMSSPLPRQISNEIGISPSHAALSTPKAEGGKECGQRKLVRRCLDLSPINKIPSSEVLNSIKSCRVDVVRIDSIISPSELNRSLNKKASSVCGPQSPDLFDSSMHDEIVSYITTPDKSLPILSSPENVDSHSKASPSNIGVRVSKFSSIEDSSNLPKENNVHCNESSMCSENKQGPISENGRFHNPDERTDKNVINDDSHISGSGSAKKGSSVDSVNHLVTGESDDIDENEKTDNVIDLTNDSSDESQSSFSADDVINNGKEINKKAVTSVSSQEDMEPLKLVESEDSEKEVNELSHEGKSPNKKKGIGVDNNLEVDIICPSPGSVISGNDDHVDTRSDKPGNENSYISNVWDDFDDVGCGISNNLPSTPDKDENLEHDDSFELPSFEKGDEIVDYTTDKKKLAGKTDVSENVSQCSTSKSSPMAPPRSSNQKCLGVATSTVGIENSSRFDPEFKKVRSCASSISDDTLVRVAGDIEDSNLWREEFEPICEDDEMVEKEDADKGLMEHKKVKTPQQKARKKNMVTPLPNYKEMASPELQKELKKFGIKPIARRKAVVLLEHVYEKTHPLVTDSEADSSYCETPLQARPGNSKTGRQKASSSLHERVITKNSKRKTINTDDEPKKNATAKTKNCKVSQVVNIHERVEEEEEEEESPLNLSHSSSTSEGSEGACFEESMLLGDGESDVAISATQKGCLTKQVTQFISSDPEFHQKVLLYEPFFVEDLLTSLKANGVKCNMRNVLDILDDQCITFRTHQGQRHRQRGRKCKRKSVGTPGKSPKRSKRANQ
ncbi:serine-rich adhesin for platelets-like isoform X2 [Palaemon carinicauda]|uniref:serine-rich adhesin for platelets-like isoform X2 n=1 Tax=Palaemon carinicauda TaxID=392227 RepID=UPI0035B588B9